MLSSYSAVCAGFMIVCLMVAAAPETAAQSPPEAENAHLFLLAGQSNMAGRGEVHEQDTAVHPRVWTVNAEDAWEPAVDPIHFDKSVAGVGPGRTFGITVAERNPSITVGLIPTAVGGSSIVSWKPDAVHEQTGIHPYDAALSRVRKAREDGALKAVLWHQGEGDSTPERAAAYKERLIDLIQRFREDLQAPELPFFIGQLGRFEGNAWSEARVEVNQAQREVAAEMDHVVFVSSKGLSAKPDGVHFDAASARELGRRFADAYRDYRQGLAD